MALFDNWPWFHPWSLYSMLVMSSLDVVRSSNLRCCEDMKTMADIWVAKNS